MVTIEQSENEALLRRMDRERKQALAKFRDMRDELRRHNNIHAKTLTYLEHLHECLSQFKDDTRAEARLVKQILDQFKQFASE